ncbi:hypothetical protein JQ574_22635 [Bradyrhizobium sp. AUGA SZCCT0158]|uniref:hypothetical protein n=1 Tax=Bradyrhizobium sp. AUGA SZCCT0158 TaxID=2807661 RepID=UPI001BA54B8E|nr:hypothetical protein [Bradyrhizobium sp. AUGA SZCCT0158]MBR1198797.1 hypothetical protein [Bradyrhizobium sp. AUGA SZCCT0158]
MSKTSCDDLANRFEKMAADGLLDVKFYVAGRELVTEQVCREVNRLYEALERGESAELDFKDSHKS